MSASVFFFYLGIAASYLVIRPLATVVHEGGHILALLLMGMKGELRIFLGSLGDWKRSWRMRIGRLQLLIHPRWLLMRGSMTDYDHPLTPTAQFFVALSGPLASAAMTVTTLLAALSAWSEGPLRAILILASIIPAMDVVLSLMYRYDPILLSNGRITANDGQVIGWLLKYRSDTDRYLHARWLFEKDDYAGVVTAVEGLLQVGHQEKLLYEYQMYSFLMLQRPQEALDLHGKLTARHRLDAFDDCLHALALEQLGRPAEAMAALESAIVKAPGNHEALNHRAFSALQAGQFDNALVDLNRAIRNQPGFAAALNNRGAVLLGRMDLVAARADLLASMKEDHENPFVHRNWAMLLLLEGDVEGAQSAFLRARLLGLREEDGWADGEMDKEMDRG